MIGLIDIGNTRLKWALVNDNRTIVASDAFSYKDKSNKDVEKNLNGCFIGDVLHNESLSRIVISCVSSPDFLSAVIKLLEQRFQVKIDVLAVTKNACGIQNAYHSLEQLGIDRWMSVVGARAVIDQGNVIVVDAGTAIKIECLSARNIYEGGVILPGFDLMHDSLVSSTSKIHSEKIEARQVIGKNTSECVNSGAYYGVGGAVDRVIHEMKTLMQSDVLVLLTGGSAVRLKSVMDTPIIKIETYLVFIGMIEVLK